MGRRERHKLALFAPFRGLCWCTWYLSDRSLWREDHYNPHASQLSFRFYCARRWRPDHAGFWSIIYGKRSNRGRHCYAYSSLRGRVQRVLIGCRTKLSDRLLPVWNPMPYHGLFKLARHSNLVKLQLRCGIRLNLEPNSSRSHSQPSILLQHCFLRCHRR